MKMTVWVGGNLPESALPDLVEALQGNELLLIDGDDVTQDTTETLLRDFKEPNSIELEFELECEQDGSVDPALDLDVYCETHRLTIKKLLPPCVSQYGEHNNEGLYYQTPGMSNPVYIPTDGEGEIVMRQRDVLDLLDACTKLSHRPLSDMPLLINDTDEVTRLYAKASLAGKSSPEIYWELLVSRVGHEEVGCPPFRIIPGW